MTDPQTARLLPWTTPDGKTCIVVVDGEGHVSRVADGMEAVQLDMADDLLGHAADMLADRKATFPELHYLARQLSGSLRDVRRVAESRGARLPRRAAGYRMTGILQVATATQSRAEAVQLAQSLVSARLAAGARIAGPVTSVFRHEGVCGTGAEWQLLLTTRADRCDEVEAHLLAHHPWRKPEVTAVPMVGGPKEYLHWVETATAPE
ncbi:divalent-cation tolerance protein CutA [Streptomyces sioyaensis]|uniref:divalent-cation tolerance protein CutA n=1 Tax=Streptomyces sioyaensis TaxID=67364 RepID=UPI0037B98C80